MPSAHEFAAMEMRRYARSKGTEIFHTGIPITGDDFAVWDYHVGVDWTLHLCGNLAGSEAWHILPCDCIVFYRGFVGSARCL